jgi:hypothetical protein
LRVCIVDPNGNWVKAKIAAPAIEVVMSPDLVFILLFLCVCVR